jgi:hypothetical protein
MVWVTAVSVEAEGMSEYSEQAALFEWAELQGNMTPELKLLFAIPNGQYRKGQRPEAGLKAGVPDLMLPVHRSLHHGLFIEMKHGRGALRQEQVEWLEALTGQGYKTAVCYGFEEARAVIEGYLDLSPAWYEVDRDVFERV